MRAITVGILLCASLAHAEATTDADIETYCEARARAVPERGDTRTSACRLLVRGALDSLASRNVAQAVEQIRSVDELMRRRAEPSACPPPPPCPEPDASLDPRAHVQGTLAEKPARPVRPKPPRRSREPADLADPFRDAKPTRKPATRDMKEPSF